jgi:hypothetical protein
MMREMAYKKLYLDDVRTPKTEGWDIVRSYDEFVNYIETNGIPDEVSFDHDLSREHTKYYFDNGGHSNPPDPLGVEFNEKTGYDSAKWLCEYCWTNGIPLPKWNVHSANPVGRDNIIHLLKNYESKLNY